MSVFEAELFLEASSSLAVYSEGYQPVDSQPTDWVAFEACDSVDRLIPPDWPLSYRSVLSVPGNRVQRRPKTTQSVGHHLSQEHGEDVAHMYLILMGRESPLAPQ